MYKKIDAWNKSKLNLRHKIIRLKYTDTAGNVTLYDQCRVVSVNLDAPGLSIVTEEGYNVIIEGTGGTFEYMVLGFVSENDESKFATKKLDRI